MIFYYTGTGNSFMVARRIAYLSKEKLVPIVKEVRAKRHDYCLEKGERLGFVFPTHCWGTPRYVDEFVDKASFHDAQGTPVDPYTFCVMTCSSSVGDALVCFGKQLAQKGITLDSAWSVAMPDNYVIAFNAPTEKKTEELLRRARPQIAAIAARVQAKTPITQFKRGILGSIVCKTNPNFKTSLGPTDEFYVTDACTGCGLCERLCTSGTIKIEDAKPAWHNNCEQCLACINCCPTQAIQYGIKKRKTESRGRYMNPALKTEPLFVAAYENTDIDESVEYYDDDDFIEEDMATAAATPCDTAESKAITESDETVKAAGATVSNNTEESSGAAKSSDTADSSDTKESNGAVESDETAESTDAAAPSDAAESSDSAPLTKDQDSSKPKRLGWKTGTLYSDHADKGEEVPSTIQDLSASHLDKQKDKN